MRITELCNFGNLKKEKHSQCEKNNIYKPKIDLNILQSGMCIHPVQVIRSKSVNITCKKEMCRNRDMYKGDV